MHLTSNLIKSSTQGEFLVIQSEALTVKTETFICKCFLSLVF